jgi:2'-5' RNA ligase
MLQWFTLNAPLKGSLFHMRLFVGLDIDDTLRRPIGEFIDRVREFAPGARWVNSESLHITLKFIGEKTEEATDEIKNTLQAMTAAAFDMTLRGYGFFPTSRAPRVFWIGIKAGSSLAALAGAIDARLAGLNIPREPHEYSPHLTLARSSGAQSSGARNSSGSGSPRRQRGDRSNQRFEVLQAKLITAPPPEFGTMTARRFFLYRSHLSQEGSRYAKLAAYALD